MKRFRFLVLTMLAALCSLGVAAGTASAAPIYTDFQVPTCVERTADGHIVPFSTTVSGVPAGQYAFVYLSGNPPAGDPYNVGLPYYADGGYFEGNGGTRTVVVGSNQNRGGTPAGTNYVSLAIFSPPSRGYETVESIAVEVKDSCVVAPVDPDTDGDGVKDSLDAFPNDPAETKDSDGDTVGDNADDFPNDSTETKDSDGDRIGDNADVFPNDASESADSDFDGVGDNGDNAPNAWNPDQADRDNDGVGDVIDGTILPTSKQQCMSSGFSQYRDAGVTYKNQGDCVSAASKQSTTR